MTGEELESRCIKLFGRKHWEKILAQKMGVHFTTVWRWRRNRMPAPSYVDTVLDAEEKLRKLNRLTSSITKQLK